MASGRFGCYHPPVTTIKGPPNPAALNTGYRGVRAANVHKGDDSGRTQSTDDMSDGWVGKQPVDEGWTDLIDFYDRLRPAWHSRAACRGADVHLFFLARDNPVVRVPGSHDGASTAKQICARCPVKAECLEAGLTTLPHTTSLPPGIWGGLAVKSRRLLKQRRNQEGTAA